MMGACNKVALYGSSDNSFRLGCPGIRRNTARSILADTTNPLAKELRAAGFKYYTITPSDGDTLPEVKL